MPRFATALLAVLTTVACRPTSAPVPAAPQSGAYVITLGSDTVAIDQYTRTGNRIEGAVLQRAPRTLLTRYTVMLGDDGMPRSIEQSTRLPDGGIPANGARGSTVTFSADSAVSRIQRDTVVTVPVAARGGFPFVGYAFSLYALPIAALRASGRDTASYVIVPAGTRAPTSITVVKKGTNSYWVYLDRFPYQFTTDDNGQIVTVDGARTTQHVVSRRQDVFDIAAMAAAFAAREQQSRPAGPLSPRDTVNATIGAAQLWVDYSRPAARGRTVFGPNGVLGDTIWRTGANAATQFRTNVPLTVAGQTVPPGTYTLWTLAIPGRYQLIVNKQTRQWGTEYNPQQDLVRVPLSVSTINAIERFTIAIEPTGANAGTLALRWGTTQLSVPFTTP